MPTETGESAKIRRCYTDSRYGQLHYLAAGPTEPSGKPVLVLLHQNPSSSLEYSVLIEEMGRDRRVIAFDTPGYGMSDGPTGPHSITEYTVGFADGLDALGVGADTKVDVFGFHTGALLAAELAILRPDLIGRVVLTGIPFRNDEECAERLASARATPPVTEDGKTVLDRFAALWRYVVVSRDPRVPVERAAFMFMEKAKSLDRFWWIYDGVWSYPFRDQLPKVAQPTLILQPREDLFEQSNAAGKLIPNAQFVDLPTLDRDVFEVGVTEFAAEFRRFLT